MRIKFLTERPFGKWVKKWLIAHGDTIVKTNPDIVIVCYYPRILKKEEYQDVPKGAINFHPGYLPFNRGMYPHIWPLVDGTPAGVTIHYIDDKIDHGDIIAQKRVPVFPTDIARDLELRTQEAIFKLFTEIWDDFKEGKLKPYKQKGKGTFHLAKEITSIQEFDAKTMFRLRACTFHDRTYGYFKYKGTKYKVGIKFYD